MTYEPVLTRKNLGEIESELNDPRTYLYSCYDLGGTDGADDWMYFPNGNCAKYEFMGLSINHSPMGEMAPSGKLFFAININDKKYRSWDNLHFTAAYADRLEGGTHYWGYSGIGVVFEVLMVKPGCARIEVTLTNRTNKETTVSVESHFMDSAYHTSEVKEEKSFTLKHGSAVVSASDTSPKKLAYGESGKFVTWICCAATPDKSAAILAEAIKTDTEKFRKRQYELSHPTALDSFDEKDRRFALKVYNDLRANIINYENSFFSAPNRVFHKGQWLWDTCFHALAWSIFDPDTAVKLLKNLFMMQEDNGFIPICYGHVGGAANYATQPPLITFALNRITDDRNTLEQFYPQLKKFFYWLENNRKLSSGLYGWNTGGESGMDNSPRFDNSPGSATQAENLDLTSRYTELHTAHVDLSCMMALFCKDMQTIASILELDEEAEKWGVMNRELREKINERLFDPETGFYHDRKEDGQWLKVKTVAAFWALVSEVADKEIATELVKHLMNEEEFLSALPVPSVAMDEQSFCFNYWRGPTWINSTHMVVEGLKTYGYDKEAKEISLRAVKGVKEEWLRTGYLWEIYNPYGGMTENMEKKQLGPRANATNFVGWTACTLNMLLGCKTS